MNASPWLKRVLIPFWIVQLALMILVVIIYILLTSFSGQGAPDMYGPLTYPCYALCLTEFNLPRPSLLIIIFCSVCIINITEIILFIRGTMMRVTYQIFQSIETGISFVMFAMIVGIGTSEQNAEATAA